MKTNSFILSTENICASYYKKEILHGVSISVSEGEIVSLIGPNGAGKSTLLKVIAGTLVPQTGAVRFLDEDVTNLSPHLRVRRGIGYFMQGGEIFQRLTVLENLELGAFDLPGTLYKERLDNVFQLFPVLAKMKKRRAGLLSGGEKQSLALGIILMRRPKLLLLDEPSAGLAPSLVKEMLAQIQCINKNFSISVLLVEQNVKEAVRISDRVYVLREGRVVDEGSSEDFVYEDKLEEVFFGDVPRKEK